MNTHTFLVVDDEEMLRELMSAYLEEVDMQVFTAQSADQALEILKNKQIDMIVTDIMLGSDLGTELYRQVHAIYPNIKALFVTGYCDDHLLQEFPEVSVLRKPFIDDDFIHAIEEVLHHEKV